MQVLFLGSNCVRRSETGQGSYRVEVGILNSTEKCFGQDETPKHWNLELCCQTKIILKNILRKKFWKGIFSLHLA